jgi:hypothetical protein
VEWPHERLRWPDTVACKAFGAAEAQPLRQEGLIAVENLQQDLLVVAGEVHQASPGRPIGPKPFDNLGGFRTAIDQVAEEDDDPLRRSAGTGVGLHLLQQISQQIVAAMDVADRVQPESRRDHCRAARPRAPEHLLHRLYSSSSR